MAKPVKVDPEAEKTVTLTNDDIARICEWAEVARSEGFWEQDKDAPTLEKVWPHHPSRELPEDPGA